MNKLHFTLPKLRLALLSFALAFALVGVSCTTTYDAYGRPVQSVDPGLALAGIVAAGAIGYAIADDRSSRKSHRNYRSHRGHHSHHSHRYSHHHRSSYRHSCPSGGYYW